MQRHEMIEAMRSLGLKGMAGAFDEAVTTGLQRKRTTHEILTDLLRAEAAHRHAASIRYRMAELGMWDQGPIPIVAWWHIDAEVKPIVGRLLEVERMRCCRTASHGLDSWRPGALRSLE